MGRSEGDAAPATPMTDGPIARFVHELEAARGGPFLYHGSTDGATALLARLIETLDVEGQRLAADTIGLSGGPVADTTAALRDSVYLRVRVLKKVYEGRLLSSRRIGPDPGALGLRAPPAKIEVVLATDSDQRTVQLEGGFATAFWQARPQVGEIIQIDTDQPLVVIRRDREEAEGYVAEERDLVYRVRLGDVDRAGVPPIPEAQPGRRPAPNAPLRSPVLGTGRLPAPSIEAMRATDRWVTDQSGGKGTRIETGVLLVTGAEALPSVALVVLREAATAPAAPVVLLQSESAEAIADWLRFFPQAVRIDHDA